MSQSNYPTYDLELELIDRGYKNVVGVDEVGRGCGAGSVVAVACRIPLINVPDFIGRVKDSKKMTAKRRLNIYSELVNICEYGIGSIDNKTIDKVNIRNATKLAMIEAIDYLSNRDYLLIDGDIHLENIAIPQQQVIKGDNVSLSIACASVIAKVVRDNIMMELHTEHPEYDWINNKGYLTKIHCEALKQFGPTKYHRLSFNKVG